MSMRTNHKTKRFCNQIEITMTAYRKSQLFSMIKKIKKKKKKKKKSNKISFRIRMKLLNFRT